MKKPYKKITDKECPDLWVRYKLISRIIKGDHLDIINDLLEKKESDFVNLLANMYVATYRIQHELNNIQLQQMINDRNDELNKLLDLYNKTINLVARKKK